MENMNKALIAACAAILPGAVWSGTQMAKPKVTLDEQWLLDRVPDSVPGYRLLGSKENPKITYRMDAQTYQELEPIGIAAQIYRDPAGNEYEAVVIAGQDMATFHDQRVCFTSQGWSLTKDQPGIVPSPDYGDVPVLDLTVLKAGHGSSPAFFMWRSPQRFTNNRRTAKFDFLKSGIFGRELQVGYSYRFMGATPGVDTEMLKAFTTSFLSQLKQAEVRAGDH